MLHHLRGVYFNNGFSLFYILLGAVLVIFFPESNLKFFSNFMTTNLLSWFAVTIYYLMTPVGWTNLVWLFKGRCEPAKWVMLAPTIPTVLILGWASYWSAVGFKCKSM